ncbi:MAG: serine/threonine-protein kinase [Bryobacteraceae bacterium]
MSSLGGLDAARWQQVEELFHQALDAADEEREAVLEAAPADVAAEARAMIAAFDAAEVTQARSAAGPSRETITAGTRLGVYRIELEISHGGMGTVYLASRDTAEFRQKVAIKVIRPGYAGEELDRRFRNERQILAALDHPNIARLLDGGSTPSGQPYLVMEFIEGEDVLEYAHRHDLSRRQRLELFLKVCGAVAHAHRHLVIHRDLKPSNILVTAEGEPKLLDFGIAKLIDSTQDATATGLGFFSPLYASPEQLSGDAVTTSTDIYSLAVVLYELLFGRRPYRLQTTSNAELVAAILLHEPEKPRGGDRLPPDLEAIVLKALRKKPAERYPSVDQFSADVERHLENRPVAARKGSWRYQALKFVERNKLTAAAAALALVATAGGVASTLFQARRAERRFGEVRQLAQYLVFDFHDRISKLPGSTQLQKDVVERSMQYLDRLSSEASGDAGLQLDLAEAYLKLGDVLGNPFNPNLGESEKAVDAYRKSMTASAGLRGAGGRAARVAADARLQLGATLGRLGSKKEALQLLDEALATHRRRLEQNPSDAALQLAYARALAGKAIAESQSGAYEGYHTGDVRKTLDTLIDHLDRALRDHPTDGALLRERGAALYRYANYLGTADPNRAEAMIRDGLATLDKVSGPVAGEVGFRRLHAGMLLTLAWGESQTGKYDDSLNHYGQAQKVLEPMSQADPSNAAARYHLTSLYRGRGIACEYAGRNECAVENFLRAASIHASLLETDPANANYASLRGELLARSARLEYEMEKFADARLHARQGIGILVGLAERPAAQLAAKLEACRALYSTPVAEVRDVKRALHYCEDAAKTPSTMSYVYEVLAHARYNAGDRKGAAAALEQALTTLPETKPGEPPSRARQTIENSLAAVRAGKPIE